jgi:hypothetical protein
VTNLARIQVVWNGLGGLPGLSVFYAPAVPASAPADLVTFFTAIRGFFPTGLTWQVPAAGDVIDDATGTLTGGWTGVGGGVVNANAPTGVYAAGTGLRIDWGTGAIVSGRRLKGRTFLCPLIGAEYQSDGTISSSAQGNITIAAQGLVASSAGLRIWHRPKTPGSGTSALINAVNVPDKVASLRSRRT